MGDANVRASDPRNYQLPGSVSLWFRKKGSTDNKDWIDLGNIIDPAIAAELTTLDHFSQRRGQRAKDRSVVSERAARINFSVDEVNLHNLQFAFGSKADAAQGQLVKVNDNLVAANPGGTAPNNTISLGAEDIDPGSVIIRSKNLVSVDEVTYTSGVDYTVNDVTGVVTILPGGALNNPDEDTGGVAEIHVFWTKEVEGQSFEIFDGQSIEGEAKFQVLTEGGAQYVIVCLNVSIRNNGDVTLGDGSDWQTVALTMELLADSTGKLGTMYVVGEDEIP